MEKMCSFFNKTITRDQTVYVVESILAKTESVLSYLTVACRQCVNTEHAPNIDIFYFDLDCDVIGEPEVNKIRFSSTTLAGL